MNEFQYFQTRTMIEQNAFRKIMPIMLVNAVLGIAGVLIVAIAFMIPSLTDNTILKQTAEPLILWGLSFFLLIAIVDWIFSRPIRIEKKRQFQVLIASQEWAKNDKKEPTFRQCESMEEYYFPA